MSLSGTPTTKGISSFADTDSPDLNGNLDIILAQIDALLGAQTDSRGKVLANVTFTSTKTATSSTETSAVTVVSAGAVTYQNAPVRVEFWCPGYRTSDNSNGIVVTLFDGTTSTVVGQILSSVAAGSTVYGPVHGVTEVTPSAGSHTYFVGVLDAGGVSSTHAAVFAGSGGSGALLPGFIKVTRAT